MKNVYVGNLPFHATEDDLRRLFEQYGKVDRASVVMDRESGRSRGFGFVEMPDDNEAGNAIQCLDGAEMDGRTLRINEARPREQRPRGGGGGFAGGGGGGGFGGGGGGFGGGGGGFGGGGGGFGGGGGGFGGGGGYGGGGGGRGERGGRRDRDRAGDFDEERGGGRRGRR